MSDLIGEWVLNRGMKGFWCGSCFVEREGKERV